MNLKKVISGGQTGADQGGLQAAQLRGLETGGHAPKGYWTLKGSNYDLRDIFNLEEHQHPAYPPRTEANVKNSDATIRFAAKFNSAGERCTLRAIRSHKKPYLDIDIIDPISPEEVGEWLEKNEVEVLNVAGNAEQTHPGIQNFVMEFLLKVFNAIRHD